MMGLLRVVALTAVSLVLLSSYAHAGETFLDRCFPNTTFLKNKIKCQLSTVGGDLNFLLTEGRSLVVFGTGVSGKLNKAFAVTKITHLPPRLSDTGAMDESVRFLAMSTTGAYVATVDIPCRQTIYAAVGVGQKQDNGVLPTEHVAACTQGN